MTYQIITNEEKVKDFITWLPELRPDECYYVALFARNKYCKGIGHIKQDKQLLKRFTTDKGRLYNKLQQLEVKHGAYVSDGVPIPQEALCTYISINPRSYEKATKIAVSRLLELAIEKYNGYNPHQEILSILAGKTFNKNKGNAVSRKLFYDFDFDNIHFNDILGYFKELEINKEAITFLQTRGGYHLLVELGKIEDEFLSTWYNSFQKLNKVLPFDNSGTDTLIPIPGTYQGGFSPRLFKI